MYFKLFSRSKNFSFKIFGQVTSKCQVVQEEMKKNAFFYYFQEEKTSLLKHLDRSRQEISGGSRRNEEKCVFYYFQEVKISLLKHLVRSRQDTRWFKKK
jgi:hypothetical protein